jgi:hypothetical protein
MKIIVTFFISISVMKFFKKCRRKNYKFQGVELVHYPIFFKREKILRKIPNGRSMKYPVRYDEGGT